MIHITAKSRPFGMESEMNIFVHYLRRIFGGVLPETRIGTNCRVQALFGIRPSLLRAKPAFLSRFGTLLSIKRGTATSCCRLYHFP